MPHYGELVYSMAKISGKCLKDIANEGKVSRQAFHRMIKKKHISTKVLHKFAGICGREVVITIK